MSFPAWHSMRKPAGAEWIIVEIVYGDPTEPAWLPARKQYPEDNMGIPIEPGFMTVDEAIDYALEQPLTGQYKYKNIEDYLNITSEK